MTQEEHIACFMQEWKAGKGISAMTSGSTGEPKKIWLPREQVKRSALRTNKFFEISANSCLHSAVSFQYIRGKMVIARALTAKCNYTWQEPSLNPTPPAGPEVALMSVTGAQMPHILRNKGEFNHVKAFLIGGSALSEELCRSISTSGLTAYESYGMTETASHIALRKIDDKKSFKAPFFPLPGIRISLTEDNRLIIDDDDIKVVTNDIARIYPEGGFEILGRSDDMIVTGGKKVLPQTIEKIISDHIRLAGHDFFIDSIPHPQWTNEIVLVVIGDEMTYPVLYDAQKEISSLTEDVLPRWQRPKKILIADRPPLTPNGKLKRRDLNFLMGLSVF